MSRVARHIATLNFVPEPVDVIVEQMACGLVGMPTVTRVSSGYKKRKDSMPKAKKHFEI